jgi:SAM-dependent methyltransferase
MKNSGIRIGVMLLLPALWLEVCHGADAANPMLDDELSRQEKIIRSRGDGVPAGYTVDRSLAIYSRILHLEFDRALENLDPAGRWLDIGAGQGQAILDYFSPGYDQGRARRGKKARAVAMSIEDRRTPLWRHTAANLEEDQLQYIYDRRLRDIPLHELGQFQIITDVIGGFSYVDALSQFVEKVLDFLRLDGRFFTVLQDVRAEDGKNKPYYPNAPFLTEIVNADGSQSGVCAWLKSISCVNVICEYKTAWQPPVETYHVHKVCNEVKVPPLVPVHFQAGTPPERRYRMER